MTSASASTPRHPSCPSRRYGCSPGVLPDQLCDDSCFAFYNPIQQRELEHYVNSWLENLVKASEYVVQNPRPNRKSKQR